MQGKDEFCIVTVVRGGMARAIVGTAITFDREL